MATEYGSRLRQARKHAKLTQMGLSKKTGIPQSTISSAERDGQGSGETPVYAAACGVDPLWLGTGRGSMLMSAQAEIQPTGGDPTGPTLDAVYVGRWLDKIKDQETRERIAHSCVTLILHEIQRPALETTPEPALPSKTLRASRQGN